MFYTDLAESVDKANEIKAMKMRNSNKWYASPIDAIKAFDLVKSVLPKIINNNENTFYVDLLQNTLRSISYSFNKFTLQFVTKTISITDPYYVEESILKYPFYTDDSDKNYDYNPDLIERCNYIYHLEVKQNDCDQYVNYDYNRYDIIVYVCYKSN